MRNLLGSKRKSNSVEELVSDGINYTSQTDIVEKCNDFFTNIANNLDRLACKRNILCNSLDIFVSTYSGNRK